MKLFKLCRPIDQDQDKETLSYNAEQKYQTSWTRTKASNHTCIMPVFDMNDYTIKADLFADKLIGSMCEIIFTHSQALQYRWSDEARRHLSRGPRRLLCPGGICSDSQESTSHCAKPVQGTD